MWLVSDGSDVRVDPESLQQGSGPPFLHADDDGLGELLLAVIRGAVRPEFAVRGADLLALPLQPGRWRRRRPNPLHGPLLGPGPGPDLDPGPGMALRREERGRPLSLGELREALRGRVKFLPQSPKSCLLRHQPPLIHVVLLQRELQRVVAAHQAVEQVSDREGEGEHE